jgi:hypothetical protein
MVKSHIPLPAQLAGHIDSGQVSAKEGQMTEVPLGNL